VKRAFNDSRDYASPARRKLLPTGLSWRGLLAGVGIGLLVVWMARCAVYAPNGLLAYRQKQSEVQQLLESNQQLEKENEELRRQANALKTDPHAIETIAREELGLVKPGEFVYSPAPNSLPHKTPSQSPAIRGRGPSANPAERATLPSATDLPTNPVVPPHSIRRWLASVAMVTVAALCALRLRRVLREMAARPGVG
jgi:cell division protein FtsB